MGVAVSGWELARAVSSEGHLGVVSGTALDAVFARRLQRGDPGGHMRRALEAFPIPEIAERMVDRYFVPGGTPEGIRLKTKPMPTLKLSRHLRELLVVSNFVEVWLAKEGHANAVGINYLEKLQIPTLPSLYGAMLGGVDYVLMGAGIPRAIPAILDRLSEGRPVELRIDVKGGEDRFNHFDPAEVTDGPLPPVKRPAFLAIVSSHILATMFAKKVDARVDGFVIEAPTAGGHNAPPRGKLELTGEGEPLYGERDEPNLDVIRQLGLPFWMAGSWAEPERLKEALELGAAGIQVGTAFAYCEESGFDPAVKQQVLRMSQANQAEVFTDPVASPTGFPFKVVQLEETISTDEMYAARPRTCDLGYLRSAYERDDGSVGWRCSSEPIDDFLEKGGAIEETVGRKCLCNALMANVGLGQTQREGYVEPKLVTSGDDVAHVARFLRPGADTYRAVDVLDYLLPERTLE